MKPMNARMRIGSAMRRTLTVRCMSLRRNTFATGFVPPAFYDAFMRATTIAAGALLLLFASGASPDTPKENAHVTELMAIIKGQENKPAGQVFMNVKLLKDVP